MRADWQKYFPKGPSYRSVQQMKLYGAVVIQVAVLWAVWYFL